MARTTTTTTTTHQYKEQGGHGATGIVGNRSRSIPCYTRLDTCNLDAGCFDAVLGRASTWNEKCSKRLRVCVLIRAKGRGSGAWGSRRLHKL